jgi:hypothetical protein
MTYIFVYGALLNIKKAKEFTKPKKGWPVLVHGLKRTLNVMGQKHLVFGVKDVPTSECNGLLIKVNAEELVKLQEREKLYTLRTLDKSRLDKKPTTNIDEIFYFYPKHVLTKKEALIKPISPKYIETCLEGAAAVSEDFLQEFLDTTIGIHTVGIHTVGIR